MPVEAPSKVTVDVLVFVDVILAGMITWSLSSYTCTNTFLVPKLWVTAWEVVLVNSLATVAFWSTVIFVKEDPSPSNEEATTACPTKFLTVIAELSLAVAAEELNVLINATLCAWEEADVAPVALAVWADALNTAILATLSPCAEALNAESPATYSALNAVAAELLNALSPATLSALKAVAADPE